MAARSPEELQPTRIAEARWRAGGLAPGRHAFLLVSGERSQWLPDIELVGGEEVDLGRVRLGLAHVELQGEGGSPLLLRSRTFGEREVTGGSGTEIPAGPWTVCTPGQLFWNGDRSLELVAGSRTLLEAPSPETSAPARLEVEVVGSPQCDVGLGRATDLDTFEPPTRAESDDEGRAAFAPLLPGCYWVHAEGITRRTEVAAGRTTRLVLVPPQGARRLLTVVDAT
jgi:hypothetical protein